MFWWMQFNANSIGSINDLYLIVEMNMKIQYGYCISMIPVFRSKNMLKEKPCSSKCNFLIFPRVTLAYAELSDSKF